MRTRRILFAADFPITNSGIASTASSILADDFFAHSILYSDQHLSINGVYTRRLCELDDRPVELVFTHTEYSKLPILLSRYPEALFHVGDWPLMHWKSVARLKPIIGVLAQLRCHLRLLRIPRFARLCFVTQEDCDGAVGYGFCRSSHLPIGVWPPASPPAPHVDSQTLCFSGNFRYEPNRDAAQRLLNLARSKLPKLTVLLVGFHANDFVNEQGARVELHDNVPSVVDFLALRRPIYVSLVETGAGAKNKILEALVAGCPILCTPQSLDASIPKSPSIKVVANTEQLVAQLENLGKPHAIEEITKQSIALAQEIKRERSWQLVAKSAVHMLDHG